MNGRRMDLQPKTIAVFVVAAALRLSIYALFPNITTILSDQVEISTPISSFKRLQEGLFLFERGVSPYDGGVFHQASLLLVIFELIPSAVVFTVLDMLNAYNLATIADRLKLPSPRFKKLDQTQIAVAYLFNPFTILSCLGSSTTIFTNATILQATASALVGNGFGTMFAMAVGTYLSIYPGLLLPPMLLFWAQSKPTKLSTSNLPALLTVYFGATAMLVTVSAILVGSVKDYLISCYGAQISVTDLTPNIGLWWYFFIEIFDSFRNFFIGVFWIHLIGYVGALTTRLPEQPLFVVIALIGLITIFKPYPSTSDISLYLGVLPLYRHIMPCKFSSISRPGSANLPSDPIHLPRCLCPAVRNVARSSILLHLDICRIRECKLFLCDHSRLESWIKHAGR